VCVITLIH